MKFHNINLLIVEVRLGSIAGWRALPYSPRVLVDYHISIVTGPETVKAFFALVAGLLGLPFKFLRMLASRAAVALEQPLILPLTRGAVGFLDQHPVALNFMSNPLIDLGILFEILLCVLFFYTPLSGIYFFAPVPWHVYIVALHGTVLLLAFEEAKKYYRRRGFNLDFLG